jgi:hypothetical protein
MHAWCSAREAVRATRRDIGAAMTGRPMISFAVRAPLPVTMLLNAR